MPDDPNYYERRLSKWFTNIGSGQPGDLVNATYRGRDADGNTDPLAGAPDGGIPGKVYKVMLLDSVTKLYAPCPDFCNGGEAPTLNKTDRAITRTLDSLGKLSTSAFKKPIGKTKTSRSRNTKRKSISTTPKRNSSKIKR